MSENLARAAAPLPSKARVLVTSFVDFAIDLILPTAIYALLAPTGLSAVIRLTIGGFFVGAKACSGRISAPGEVEGRSGFSHTFLVGALIAVVSTAVTVATIRAGGSEKLAMGLGTAVLVLVQAANLARTRRRLDGFAVLVALEMAATIVLTSISNDPRFVLMRPSFYTAIAGIYVFTTVWTARPFMMQVSKPMAAAGDPVRAEAFERAGRESLRFRRAEQAMTIGLSIVLLGESVLRVITVLSRPADNLVIASLWSHIPGIGLFVVYFAVMKLVFVPRASREVDALMPAVLGPGSDSPVV
jgi:hypothetical protein